MKRKCDHAKETGGGPVVLDFTEDENVMYRIMGNRAVLDGIDGGVDTAESTEPSQATQPKVAQSHPTASITPQAVTPVINMEALPPKVLLLHARQLVLSHTLPEQHVVPVSKANGEPITALPLDESPNTAAAVPQNNPAPPQESQTPGTSDVPQGMRVQSICDAQEAIPHLRKYNIISDCMSF